MERVLSVVCAIAIVIFLVIITIGSCTDADMASYNLSRSADMFEINRRVVFYNGITDTYILSIEGRCSVEFCPDKFVVTVKTGPEEYKKHFLGRADNVFPFVEQLDNATVGVFQHRVIFKPKAFIPNIDLVLDKK